MALGKKRAAAAKQRNQDRLDKINRDLGDRTYRRLIDDAARYAKLAQDALDRGDLDAAEDFVERSTAAKRASEQVLLDNLMR